MAEPLNRLPAHDRYHRDPVFRQLVTLLYTHMEHAHREGISYTPTELREAAMLAAEKYEELHIRPIVVETLP